MSVLDVITLEQLRALRAAGFVVVHQAPTENMRKAGAADKWPEDWSIPDIWHRMVGQSIREQNAEMSSRIPK